MAGNEPDEDGQRGVVVNTASIAGIEGQTGQVAYGAAKAAILGHDPADGPRPGALRHPGVRHRSRHHGHPAAPRVPPRASPPPWSENIIFPKRMGKPSEFGLLVESIARNPYLNGENIRLDGALRFPPK